MIEKKTVWAVTHNLEIEAKTAIVEEGKVLVSKGTDEKDSCYCGIDFGLQYFGTEEEAKKWADEQEQEIRNMVPKVKRFIDRLDYMWDARWLPAHGWQDVIRKGFSECFRVLQPGGFLIFKWNETDIRLSEILKLTDEKPIFGHIRGKRANTHWLCFMKPEHVECKNRSPYTDACASQAPKKSM